MKKIILIFVIHLLFFQLDAQNIGINTTGGIPNASAGLDIDFTNKGLLLPRVVLTGTNVSAPVTTPATSLLVYNTATVGGANAVSPGFYYWDGTIWQRLASGGVDTDDQTLSINGDSLFIADGNFVILPTDSLDLSLTGNAGTNSATNFIGTTDAQPLSFRVNDTLKMRLETNGTISILNTGLSVFVGENAGLNDDLSINRNTFVGNDAGRSNTTGFYNTAIGEAALRQNTIANYNTAMGAKSLFFNTTGTQNNALGFEALYRNTTGINNVALGVQSMYLNTSGGHNAAIGVRSLYRNTTGSRNIAIGHFSMEDNTTGNWNTAVGSQSLPNNTTGQANTAIGYESLQRSTTASNNTMLGYQSAYANTSGMNNTGVGLRSLFSNTVGNHNASLGYNALVTNDTGSYNTAVGSFALRFNDTGNYNTALGYNALASISEGDSNLTVGAFAGDNITTGSHNLIIGAGSDAPSAAGSNQMNIGNIIYGENIDGVGTTVSTGNVGIGVTNPSEKLHVEGGARVNSLAGVGNRMVVANANGVLGVQAIPANGDITGVTAGAGITGGGTIGNVTVTAAADNGLYVNGGADRIRLGGALVENTTITNGVFGMTYNLNSTGDFRIQDAGITHFDVSDNGNTRFGGDVEWRDENTAGTLLAQIFDDGNDGRFIIRENGGVSVDLDANTQFIFNEQGLDRNFRVESDANPNMLFVDAGSNRVGIGTGAPVYDLQLLNNSAAKPGTNTWTIASDSLLKEDVNTFKDGLSTLRGLNPVYFKYNGKANIKDENYYVGVLAQDLERVAPYMVGSFESEDSNKKMETYKSVDNGAMTYVTINAIKELDEKQNQLAKVVKNISNFGVEVTKSRKVFIPFNEDFKNLLSTTPVVTVTPVRSNVTITIVSQTKEGFTVEIDSDSEVTFNWIAMAKIKSIVSQKHYSAKERTKMLNKVKVSHAGDSNNPKGIIYDDEK